MAPLVSIGLPVYNGERYLEQAINSIISQDIEDFELIISDNASTDRTAEICRRFAERDGRIRYIRQRTNLGAAANYNRVFQLATGRYFRWAAHDDVMAPSLLRRCVEVLENSAGNVVLCYPKAILIDANGDEIGCYDDALNVSQPRPHQRLLHVLRNLRMCNAAFGVVRPEALRQTRLIGSFVASDMVLLAELSLQGQFRIVQERLFYRRRHEAASCFANRSLEARAAWFDPVNRGRHVQPLCKHLVEHLRAVGRADLPWKDKLRCFSVVLAHWLPRWRAMGGEVKRALKCKLGLAPLA